MDFTEYLKPELLILVPVLYLMGMGLKKAAWFKDSLIPVLLGVLLGVCGVVLAAVWVFATADVSGGKAIATAAFTAITQGVLCAGASVYVNQLVKQATSKKE